MFYEVFWYTVIVSFRLSSIGIFLQCSVVHYPMYIYIPGTYQYTIPFFIRRPLSSSLSPFLPSFTFHSLNNSTWRRSHLSLSFPLFSVHILSPRASLSSYFTLSLYITKQTNNEYFLTERYVDLCTLYQILN